ncbi:hypothetical protein [Singulisphaera sp. PoT]|uniref:hypothetical protein n=1 Tax=Singulisphaera sp. PoT TaxID=3411797 RepID=UPI003BF46B51
MPSPLDDVSCACLPSKDLVAMADLRHLSGILVAQIGDLAWVRWNPKEHPVLNRVLPISGVELFIQRGGQWYRPGHRVPAFDVSIDPSAEQRPLASVLFPAPITGSPPPGRLPSPAPLSLVADDEMKTTTAIVCDIETLSGWAESVFSHRIENLVGARCSQRVIVRGAELPAIEEALRFWGNRVLVPLGWSVEPDLTELVLCHALNLALGEIAIFQDEGIEIVPGSAFRNLSRASIRLALRESSP